MKKFWLLALLIMGVGYHPAWAQYDELKRNIESISRRPNSGEGKKLQFQLADGSKVIALPREVFDGQLYNKTPFVEGDNFVLEEKEELPFLLYQYFAQWGSIPWMFLRLEECPKGSQLLHLVQGIYIIAQKYCSFFDDGIEHSEKEKLLGKIHLLLRGQFIAKKISFDEIKESENILHEELYKSLYNYFLANLPDMRLDINALELIKEINESNEVSGAFQREAENQSLLEGAGHIYKGHHVFDEETSDVEKIWNRAILLNKNNDRRRYDITVKTTPSGPYNCCSVSRGVCAGILCCPLACIFYPVWMLCAPADQGNMCKTKEKTIELVIHLRQY